MDDTEATRTRTGPISALARLSVRRKWTVLVLWVALIPALLVSGNRFGAPYADDLRVPGMESQEAVDLLREHFPAQENERGTATLVARSTDGPITEPDDVAALAQLIAEIEGLPGVAGVIAPNEAPGRVSADGAFAYATVQYAQQAKDLPRSDIERLVELVEARSTESLQLEVGGAVVSAAQRSELSHTAEIVGLAAAVVILTLALGTVVSALLPIATGVAGLAAGLLLLRLLAGVVDLGKITPSFATMIGLGVGIDYALFVVMRYREALARGVPTPPAIVEAVDTAGRAVLTAGGVVIIALLGLNAAGIPFVGALGLAAAVIVAVAVLVAVTLLPAVLAMLGPRIERGRIRPVASPKQQRGTAGSNRLTAAIQRHPARWAIVSFVLLVTLALPLLDLRLAIADDGYAPDGTPAREGYDLMAEGFGDGVLGPLQVVIESTAGEISGEALAAIPTAIAQTDGVASITPARVSEDGRVARLTVVPSTGPHDEATADLVETLRNEVIPAAAGDEAVRVLVGGQTVVAEDISRRLVERMPLFFALVLGLSFLLLMMVFRSLAVPVKAVVMNLLSIGAAYGVLVAVFQWGWAAGLFGIDQTGPIEAYLPMILFAVLFGLSTDYEVFLLSRIRERYLDHHDNARAVGEGLTATARVISAAAAIMVTVFLAFLVNDAWFIKQAALGLAVAVLVDATLVRLVLVPATMELLGDWNWWLPGWLDRILPRLNVEGEQRPDLLPSGRRHRGELANG